MVLETGSTSRILSRRCSDSTTSPLCGIWPPTRPVLPPCGTIAGEVSFAILRISDTSCVEPGRSTTGVWPVHSARNSTRYGACRSLSVMAFFSPTTLMKRARVACERPTTGFIISFMGRTFPWRCGPCKPVIDCLAQAFIWDRHDGDAGGTRRIQCAQVRKQVRGGFDQVADGREVQDTRRSLGARRQ